jgi:hypothetical protein
MLLCVLCLTFWYSLLVSLTYQHNTVFLNRKISCYFLHDSVLFSQSHCFNVLSTYLVVIIHSTVLLTSCRTIYSNFITAVACVFTSFFKDSSFCCDLSHMFLLVMLIALSASWPKCAAHLSGPFHKTVDGTSVNCHDFNCCIFAVCLLLSAKRNTFMLWQHYYNLPNTVPPVPWTVPWSATMYCALFGPLYILSIKEFPAAAQMRDQHTERRFYTVYFTHWWLTSKVLNMGSSGF